MWYAGLDGTGWAELDYCFGFGWGVTYGICYGEVETLDFAHSGVVRE